MMFQITLTVSVVSGNFNPYAQKHVQCTIRLTEVPRLFFPWGKQKYRLSKYGSLPETHTFSPKKHM